MSKNLTRIAQTHDVDDIDDLVEDECRSTPTGALKDTRGMKSDAWKGRKRRKEDVRAAREFKDAMLNLEPRQSHQ